MLISFDAAMGIHPTVALLRTSQIAVQAGNIFNAETPGYRALAASLNFSGPIREMTTTHERHANFIKTFSDVELSLGFRNAGEIASDSGNDVALALEQAELAQSMDSFNISVSLIRERLGMLDMVISGR